MPSRVQRRHGSNHTHRVLEEAGFDSEAVVAAAHTEEHGLHLRATATDDVDRTPSDLGPRHNGLSGAVRPSTSNPAFDSSGGYLVPHNLPLPGRDYALLAHGRAEVGPVWVMSRPFGRAAQFLLPPRADKDALLHHPHSGIVRSRKFGARCPNDPIPTRFLVLPRPQRERRSSHPRCRQIPRERRSGP